MWWLTPLILAPNPRQTDLWVSGHSLSLFSEFQSNQGYKVKHCLKTKQTKSTWHCKKQYKHTALDKELNAEEARAGLPAGPLCLYLFPELTFVSQGQSQTWIPFPRPRVGTTVGVYETHSMKAAFILDLSGDSGDALKVWRCENERRQFFWKQSKQLAVADATSFCVL